MRFPRHEVPGVAGLRAGGRRRVVWDGVSVWEDKVLELIVVLAT